MQQIKVTPAAVLKPKPDQSKLGFGKYFTDHMFVMDYTDGIGWHDPQIVPYGPIPLSPGALVLHYAQETFEGMKAYPARDGRVLLFRPEMNAKRMSTSNARLYMPEIPVEDFIGAIRELVLYEKEWIPTLPETSLYIRPFVFATEEAVGVHPSKTYKFVVILSPVGAYYPEGMNPVKIMVEDFYVRAVRGGMGFAKTGGNYASSIKAAAEAGKKGYTQVLWLDGLERKYVEEVGAMNVMFKIDGEVITPPLDGSILPGVTRDSVLTLLKHWGVPVIERKLSIDELMEAGENGRLEEGFGTGTAAVISPIGELCYKDKKVTLGGFKTGPLTQKLYDTLTGIQWGDLKDEFGWVMELK
ncbi:MAG: branched-chain amino acid aminotransferase [Fibrobacter sp.]|nr:branched-chain amino acid aminotransferase [Fibrobacter sp.]